MNIITNAVKGGRSRTGRDRHSNITIIHAIPGEEEGGYWGGSAVCGATIKGGFGWYTNEFIKASEVNCPKCRKKLGLPPLD